MRAWYRARRKERAARKAQKALDRLHGTNARPHHRRSIGGGVGAGSSDGFGDGLGDLIGDVLGGLFEALFKFFD